METSKWYIMDQMFWSLLPYAAEYAWLDWINKLGNHVKGEWVPYWYPVVVYWFHHENILFPIIFSMYSKWRSMSFFDDFPNSHVLKISKYHEIHTKRKNTKDQLLCTKPYAKPFREFRPRSTNLILAKKLIHSFFINTR